MSDKTVILIHGLWMTGLELLLLQRRLERKGFAVNRFRYGTVSAGLDANLTRLQAFVQRQQTNELHLIGHSLGGVLALQLLQRYPDMPVDRVVCLGSPLVDSSAARTTLQYAWGRRLVGKTLAEAVVEKPLRSWQGRQLVGVIAGSRPRGFSHRFTQIASPNDGMVVVAETRLTGLTDHLVLPVSHTGLVFDRQVARQCDWFLCHGCFKR